MAALAACKSPTIGAVTPTLAANGVNSSSPQLQPSMRVAAAALPALHAASSSSSSVATPSERRNGSSPRGHQSSNWTETFKMLFKEYPDVGVLDLSRSNISDAGLAALIDCLRERTKNSLEELRKHTGINTVLIDACLKAHEERDYDVFIQKLEQIEAGVADRPKLLVLVRRCIGLRNLNLSRCSIQLSSVHLTDFPMLQILDLSGCQRISFRADMWPQYLRRVNLEGCLENQYESSQVSLGLPSLVRTCVRLTYLNLNHIANLVIRDDVLGEIFRLQELERLELRGVFRNAPPQMANWILGSPRLREVIYDGVRMMTRQEASDLVCAPAAVVAPPAQPSPRATRCRRVTQWTALAALGILVDWALPVVAIASVYLSRRFWR